MARIQRLTAHERYEEAASHRDRLQALTAAIARSTRLRSLGGCAEMVAAQPDPRGGWQVVVIRHGRLAAAGWAAPGVSVVPFATSLRRGADDVLPGIAGYPAATSEEVHCLLRWLDSPGTRLISLTGVWSCPRWGGVAAEGVLGQRLSGFDPAV
jgi:DNA polymerase-3 subunit epsilon